ncbi:MAG: carbon-nitrogen hydrolase family protein [Myxococcota bacterium]
MSERQPITVAVAQLCSGRDLEHNLRSIEGFCERAKQRGAHWVCMPENSAFLGMEGEAVQHAAPVDSSPLVKRLQAIAQRFELVLFVGSIPERGDEAERAFNSTVVIGRGGNVLATYRKIHLFDVELPDGSAIRESDGWIPGTSDGIVEVDGWSVGLSVCYDLRFPELYRRLSAAGAQVLMVPSAFTLQTGKDHWEPLLRARAIENQCYVVAAAQWGEHFPGRVTWGKSMVVDPWGTILTTAPERPSLVTAELDPEGQERVRERFPSLRHRRD